ncbi:MAG: hypothetical protein AAF789_00555 [Bacteroidota bacterium]
MKKSCVCLLLIIYSSAAFAQNKRQKTANLPDSLVSVDSLEIVLDESFFPAISLMPLKKPTLKYRGYIIRPAPGISYELLILPKQKLEHQMDTIARNKGIKAKGRNRWY